LFFVLITTTTVLANPKEIEYHLLTIEDKSSHVLTGTVLSVDSYWVQQEKSRRIQSTAIIQVDNYEKSDGREPLEIKIQYWGGEIGDIGEISCGIPGGVIKCVKGEKVRIYCVMDYPIAGINTPLSMNRLEVKEENSIDIGILSFNPPSLKVEEEFGWGFYWEVGYYWDDTKWDQTYHVNDNCLDLDDEDALIETSFNTWENYGQCEFSFTRGSDTDIDYVDLDDHVNAVFWKDAGIFGNYAQTEWKYYVATKEMIEWDLWFNDYYTWYDGAQANKFDVRNAATHEIGHVICLEHVSSYNNRDNTMYYTMSFAETKKRSLEDGDKAGAQYLYPQYNVPTVSILEPTDNSQPDSYSYMDIGATSSVSGGSITEAKFKVTTKDDFTYDSSWDSMTNGGGGNWYDSWYTGSRIGYYYVTVRSKSNNSMYGYHIHTIYLSPD